MLPRGKRSFDWYFVLGLYWILGEIGKSLKVFPWLSINKNIGILVSVPLIWNGGKNGNEKNRQLWPLEEPCHLTHLRVDRNRLLVVCHIICLTVDFFTISATSLLHYLCRINASRNVTRYNMSETRCSLCSKSKDT